MRVLLFCAILCASDACSQDFMPSFTGNWKGTLSWYVTGKKVVQQVPMELRIQRADSADHYSWLIIYGEPGKDQRPYLLKPVDTAKGHWIIDERNGIVLDQYWVGGKFCSSFSVQASTISACYWLEKENMLVEFIATGAKPRGRTGGASKDIPEVLSYEVKSYQKAVLSRQ